MSSQPDDAKSAESPDVWPYKSGRCITSFDDKNVQTEMRSHVCYWMAKHASAVA